MGKRSFSSIHLEKLSIVLTADQLFSKATSNYYEFCSIKSIKLRIIYLFFPIWIYNYIYIHTYIHIYTYVPIYTLLKFGFRFNLVLSRLVFWQKQQEKRCELRKHINERKSHVDYWLLFSISKTFLTCHDNQLLFYPWFEWNSW